MAGIRDSVVGERVLSEHAAYNAVELTIRTPDGEERTKPIVRHPGSVVIVPLIEQPGRAPRVVLVHNERVAVGEALYELPAGTCEAGESPSETAERELREETGFRATSLYDLGRFHTSPGMTDELMHAFVAVGLVHVGQDLQPGEVMTVHKMAAGDLLEKIDSNQIVDAKTMLAVLMAHRKGYLRG